MLYFVLGIGALLLAHLALKGFTRANVAVLARQIRLLGGGFAIAGAAVLGLRGSMVYALPLASLGFWLLFGGRGIPWGTWQGGQPSAGRTSTVATDHLQMELDHDTGAMRGRVLKGVFQGRSIESLAPAEMALMWRDCRFVDPRSAQLIEAYLDRTHPTWREDMARAENEPGAGGIMTREEAYDILGLKPGASEEEIRRAHRDLMKKLHPDRGGSDYLASKINEAKDLLLNR